MPSPIGHALAGVAISLAVPQQPGAPGRAINWKRAGACAFFAALPDIDLLYLPAHRTATHSVPVAMLFTIIAIAVTGKVTTGLAIGLAWSSHTLMDWLGADANPPYGIQLLWPFSERWFFSGVNLFPGTERRDPLGTRALMINLRAVVQETVVMGLIALGIWAVRRRSRPDSVRPNR